MILIKEILGQTALTIYPEHFETLALSEAFYQQCGSGSKVVLDFLSFCHFGSRKTSWHNPSIFKIIIHNTEITYSTIFDLMCFNIQSQQAKM